MHYLVIETQQIPARNPNPNKSSLPHDIKSIGTWLTPDRLRRIHLLKTHDIKLLEYWLSKRPPGVKFEVIKVNHIDQARTAIKRLFGSGGNAEVHKAQDTTNDQCLPVDAERQKLAPDDIAK